MKALYSSWSRTGSSCSVAAWAWRVIVRNRIRSGSSPSVRVESLRSTRTPRSAIRWASASGHPRAASSRGGRSRRSGRRRPSAGRSAAGAARGARPRAYVLPDPLWPQRKVCRLNPPARRLASAPTSPVRQVPIVRVPAAAPCRPPSSAGRARSMVAPRNGGRSPRCTAPASSRAPMTTPNPVSGSSPVGSTTSTTWPRSRTPSAAVMTTMSPGATASVASASGT